MQKTMSGKVVLVTGATDGIGRQTALQLALMGADVLVHGRSNARLAEAAEWLARSAGVAVPKVLKADLASLADVRRLAAEAADAHGRLDVLVNNAGVYMTSRSLTVDGFETTFAVNHLAPFLLSNLLLPVLEKSSDARVVTVSSIAHNRGILNWDNLQAEQSFDPYGVYALSKLCNVLFACELAKRAAAKNVCSNALHPGVITTKLLMTGFGSTGASVESGATTSVYLASSPEAHAVTGQYFVDAKAALASRVARDSANQAKLWELSERFCGLA